MNRTWQRFKGSYLLFSFKQDSTAIFSFLVLLILLITGLLAPLISPYDPYDPGNIDIMTSEMPPSWMEEGESAFLLGTDIQGRDLLSTMIHGLRLSILIGCGAVVLQGLLGVVVGLLAGYLGGKIDALLMRIADIQLSFPYLMVAIFISAIFQVAFGIGRYRPGRMAGLRPHRPCFGLGREEQGVRGSGPGDRAQPVADHVSPCAAQHHDVGAGHLHHPGGQRHHE
jgi:peptide/nickel transport system permease protein